MTPLHIMHLISGFGIGGAERNLLNLVRDPELSQVCYSIAYRYEGSALYEDFAKLGLPMVRLQYGRYALYNPWRWREINELRDVLVRQHVDVLHAHMPPSLLFGPLAARKAGVVSVASVHAMRAQLSWAQFAQAPLMRSRIDCFIEGSQGVENDLLQAKVSANKIARVPYGVDGVVFNSNKAELRREFRRRFNIPDSAFVVGRVARFHPDKGFDLLIALLPQLRQHIPELKVVLVGDGAEMASLLQQVKDLDLQQTVIFTGFFLKTEQALAAFDLVAITARAEALSISTLEAMAAGRVQVYYKVGGLAEGIPHGENGLGVEFGDTNEFIDAILRIYKDKVLRSILEQRSLEIFAQKYSVQAMRTAVKQVYMRLSHENSTLR